MTDQPSNVMDLTNTKENEVLSMFFDENFVPHHYLDALFATSLNPSNKPKMQNKSIEFASSRSLNSLQNKCSSLLTHLDYYTNELTRQFEQKLQDLQNSSSIILYSSSEQQQQQQPQQDNNRDVVGITRLEYYVENLASSINSLNRDLSEVNSKLSTLTTTDNTQTSSTDTIASIKKLNTVKKVIESTLDVFETVNAIVTTSTIEDEKHHQEEQDSLMPTSNQLSAYAQTGSNTSDNVIMNVDVNTFNNSLSILQETILEQIQFEKQQQHGNDAVNNELIDKIDLMINLLPFFKNLNVFYGSYNSFVNFLQAEKKRYLSRFSSVTTTN